MTERLSKGYRKHVRDELAAARKEADSKIIAQVERKVHQLRQPPKETSSKNRRISNRLTEISTNLSDPILLDTLSLEKIAELQYERIWLNFASGEINREERLAQLRNFFSKLEESNIVGFDHLHKVVGQDPKSNEDFTLSSKIRDSVLGL